MRRAICKVSISICLLFAFGISLFPGARAAVPPAPEKAPVVVQDNVIVDDATEAVIKAALKYLAAKQTPNGSWNSGGGEHPVAMTAYTLMAFLAAGNTPNEGEYGKQVNRGMQYLLDRVGPDGYISTGAGGGDRAGSNMYGHGIAAIALAEIYGMSKDPRLKQKLELAVHLIENCQNDQGGWRYQPRKTDADLSVTVLQVVALRAAKNGGIDVAQTTIDNAIRYVKSCYDEKHGAFTYNPTTTRPALPALPPASTASRSAGYTMIRWCARAPSISSTAPAIRTNGLPTATSTPPLPSTWSAAMPGKPGTRRCTSNSWKPSSARATWRAGSR